MRLWPRSLKWRTILLTLLGLVAIVGTVGYVWWRPIRQFLREEADRDRQRNSSDPVERALARGHIRAGSTVEELIAIHPPLRRWHHDGYETLYFGEPNVLGGIWVVAIDGRLVSAIASFCTEAPVFFDTFSKEEREQYEASREADRDRRIQGVRNAHGAVGGFFGCVEFGGPLWKFAHPDPYPDDLWERDLADPHRAVGGVTAFMPYSTRFRDVIAGTTNQP